MDKKAIGWLYGQIPDLISKNIINEDTAEKLKKHYGALDPDSTKPLILTLFGVLGAIFIGLGIILMIGYNWEEFSRPVKTGLSFLPLILGQAICIFVILKKYSSTGWREASAIFLMAGVSASISLISQTYNTAGDFSDFLIVWMLLSMPMIYIMRSSVVAFFYLVGLTFWSSMTSLPSSFLFWPFAALLIPEIINAFKENPYSNRSLFLSWAMPICLGINLLITLDYLDTGLWVIIFSSYFSLLYLTGQLWFGNPYSFFLKPFQVMGMAGVISLAVAFTYRDPWRDSVISNTTNLHSNLPAEIMAIGLPIIILYLMTKFIKNDGKYELMIGSSTLLVIICYFISNFQVGDNPAFINQLIFNIYLLTVGIVTIITGNKNNRMSTVNGGMLIIALIIMLRFFDIDLSFLTRGIVFILIGFAFFISNYMMARKKPEVKDER